MKAIANPIRPETSTKLKPINAHFVRVSIYLGLVLIALTKPAKIAPTPYATPRITNVHRAPDNDLARVTIIYSLAHKID